MKTKKTTRIQASFFFSSDERMIEFQTIKEFKDFCKTNKDSIESVDGVEHSFWDEEWGCEDWIECGMSSQKFINLSNWVDEFNWKIKNRGE